MAKQARIKMLAGALMLFGLSAFVLAEPQRPSKAAGPKPAGRQITLTLVRWPYT